ncbi:MAG: hypothetical protein ACRDRO_26015 [Pseudonocardiaceae bacterium]
MPAVEPAWDEWAFVARGPVLYSNDQPVVMCASLGLARDLAAELSARYAAALPLVLAEQQRRGDVVAELRRQIASLERQLNRLRTTSC